MGGSARDACLLSLQGGQGLGAEAWASVLAGRESGKKSTAAEEARDVFFLLCFAVREERGFRASPKRAPEMGTSRGCQRGPQRRAGDAKAAAAATKKPVCEHRSLSTPPLPGACAARHGQGPMSQGQIPRENAQRASGWCNVTTPLTGRQILNHCITRKVTKDCFILLGFLFLLFTKPNYFPYCLTSFFI